MTCQTCKYWIQFPWDNAPCGNCELMIDGSVMCELDSCEKHEDKTTPETNNVSDDLRKETTAKN